MIPKVIHYCWFGGNPLPELAVECIASWKKYCKDYVIKEWNESNFDIACCDYVLEAGKAKKWAFVSDYARFWILYHEGGVYFDTDVELIKPIEDIISKGAFMGCEPRMIPNCKKVGKNLLINGGAGAVVSATVNCAPGLGLGVNPGLGLYKEILEFYQSIHYLQPDGTPFPMTVVDYTTNILIRNGWIPDGSIQTVAGITIYPPRYFCPLNYDTGEIVITEETRSIHHYTASWQSAADKKYYLLTIALQKRLGYTLGKKLGRIIDFPHRVYKKISKLGVCGTMRFAMGKIYRILRASLI